MAADDLSRIETLLALGLLDTPPEAEFDAIARLANAVVGGTAAVVALVDADRMWMKARVGDLPAELPRRETFCDTVIRIDAPLIVDNAALDPRFCDLPLVRAGLRFYAGLPIRVADEAGEPRAVGTLCVIDSVARQLTADVRASLDELAGLAEALIAARKVAREALVHATTLERQQRVFDQAERMAKMGWWRLDLDDDRIEWSDGIFRIHELTRADRPTLAEGLDFYPPASRALVSRSLAEAIETGQPFDIETDFITARGQPRRVRAMGEVEREDGRPCALVGVFRDVTEEHALADALRRSADADPLTGIANRAAFTRSLESAIGAARADTSPLALALIDLDGFKRINDNFGHLAGDAVLKAVAERLHAPWLRGSCAARLGGDEFAVIVDDPDLLVDPGDLLAALERELCVRTEVGGLTLESGASVGLMRFDAKRFTTQDAFIQAADVALYAAKRRRVGERRAA